DSLATVTLLIYCSACRLWSMGSKTTSWADWAFLLSAHAVRGSAPRLLLNVALLLATLTCWRWILLTRLLIDRCRSTMSCWWVGCLFASKPSRLRTRLLRQLVARLLVLGRRVTL